MRQQAKNTIKVWDLFVRTFHWLLALSFLIAYLTEDDLMTLHVWSGYLIVVLVVMRFIWGFIGPVHSRWSDFIKPPSTILIYIKTLIQFRSEHYLGHNPAGGAMVVGLLICLVLTSVTGLFMYGIAEHSGLLVFLVSDWPLGWAETFEEAHEFLADLTLFLVFCHIAGVLLSSWIHKENLIRAMITGNKQRSGK